MTSGGEPGAPAETDTDGPAEAGNERRKVLQPGLRLVRRVIDQALA